MDHPAPGKLPDNYSHMSDPRRVRLLDLVSKNTGHPVKFEIQIKNNYFLSISISHVTFEDIIRSKLFTVYLKFKSNWASYILSGNSTGETSRRSSQLSQTQNKLLNQKIMNKENGCFLKPLSFRVICYAARDN